MRRFLVSAACASAVALTACTSQFPGSSGEVDDDAGRRCTKITVPLVNDATPTVPTTLPGAGVVPCPSSTLQTDMSATSEIQNRSAQPAALMYYGDIGPWHLYAQPGALVVTGRGNYADQPFKDISFSGGSVLIYIDPILGSNGSLQPDWDRYGRLLKDASEFGPAVPLWPGMPQASEYGWLLDFRPYTGNVLHDKLPKVLDLVARENPHMAGWFIDDVGSRSWYSGINWGAVSAADKQAYRDGAIEITKTARRIADKYKLMTIVNGTWTAGDGGGYPDYNQHGNAVVDAGFIENHRLDQFWRNYADSPQWASKSPLTRGKSMMWASNKDNCTAMKQYVDANLIAYGTCQSNDGQVKEPWGSFHSTGLPSKVTYR